MENNNPYQAPVASVELNNATVGEVCTIEEALSRGYDFSVSEVISKAWSGVSGVKLSFLLGLIFVAVMSMLLQFIFTFLAASLGSVTFALLFGNLVSIICTTFLAGFAAIALRQTRDQTKGFLDDFFYIFNRFGALFLANLIVSIIMFVIIVALLVVFGSSMSRMYDMASIIRSLMPLIVIGGILMIFIQVSFCMIYYIIIEHTQANAIQAIITSFKLVLQRFWKILGVFCLVLVISFVVAIALGIVAGLLGLIPILGIIIVIVLYLVVTTFLMAFYYLAVANIYNAMFLK